MLVCNYIYYFYRIILFFTSLLPLTVGIFRYFLCLLVPTCTCVNWVCCLLYACKCVTVTTECQSS